jgi:multiple sugar transport system permease protein
MAQAATSSAIRDQLRQQWTRARGGPGAYHRIFLAPSVAVVLLLTIFPLLFSLGLTFTDLDLFQPTTELHFVGFHNWIRLVHDGALRETIGNTVILVVGGVALQYVIGLVLALLLERAFRLRRFFQVFFLLPMMISPIAVGFIIGRMMLGEAFGPINDLFQRVGLHGVSWYGSPWMARATLILVDTWQWAPFMMLILLAGLIAIPREPLEAARVDGASAWQVFRFITFPLLIPATLTAILIRSLELFKLIDIIRVVTGGGPGRATESVTAYVYDLGAQNGDVAYASTAAYALLITVIVLSTIFLILTRRATRAYAT